MEQGKVRLGAAWPGGAGQGTWRGEARRGKEHGHGCTVMIRGFDHHRSRVLALLVRRGADGVTTDEMSDPSLGGHEGPRRLRELRELGYDIVGVRLGTGYWRYHIRQPGEALAYQGDLFTHDE